MLFDHLRDIERAAVRSWPALESHAIDGWIWRFTSGGSIRANSVAALDDPGADVDCVIDCIEALYRERSAPAVFTVSDVSQPPDLDTRLAARGYLRGDDHVTMTKVVRSTVEIPAACVVATTPPDGWMEAYLSGLSADRRTAAPKLIANLPKPSLSTLGVFFIAHRIGSTTTSSGLTVIDGTLASIQCMATVTEARGRGGAKAVLAAIEVIAAQHGATSLYLQTSGDNTAARALYTAAGFTIAGRYHTRTKS